MKYQIKNERKGITSFLKSMSGIMLLWGVIFIASCKSDPEPERYLKVQPADRVEFTNAGGVRTVAVDTNIEGWTVSVDGNWASATKTANGVEVTASPNPQNAERKTSLRITAGTYTSENKVLEVVQSSTHMTVSPEEIQVAAAGEVVDITVVTNVDDWTFSLDPANAWMSAAKISSGLRLTVDANTDYEPRTGTVRIIAEDYELDRLVTVTQDEALRFYLTIDMEGPVELAVGGESLDIEVSSSDAGWTYSLEPNAAWLTAVKTETGLSLTAENNLNWGGAREVTVRFSAHNSTLEESLELTQNALVEQQIRGEVDGVQMWWLWGLYGPNGNSTECLSRGCNYATTGSNRSNNDFRALFDGISWAGNWWWLGNDNMLKHFIPEYTENTFPHPAYMSIDLGREAYYTRFIIYPRNAGGPTGNWFRANIFTKFELWGTNNPKALVTETSNADRITNLRYWTDWEEVEGTGAWRNDWVKLGEYTLVPLPSGVTKDYETCTQEDIDFLANGFHCDVAADKRLTPVRYVRFVLLEHNSTSHAHDLPSTQMSELKFFGAYAD